MNDNFEKDPRRIQELKGRPIADKIYKDVFGQDTIVERTEPGDSDITLDKKFAIDVKLTLPSKQILLGQEKFLSQMFASFRSITVEYFQNPYSEELGDWFKLASQFYFVGYFNKYGDYFEPWILSDWLQIVYNTNIGNIHWNINKNKDNHARANFYYTKMDNLPDNCIIASSFKDGTNG